jgi:hypothetical protein
MKSKCHYSHGYLMILLKTWLLDKLIYSNRTKEFVKNLFITFSLSTELLEDKQ